MLDVFELLVVRKLFSLKCHTKNIIGPYYSFDGPLKSKTEMNFVRVTQ